MGFGMLGCQCCPTCEAIYPTSDGPDNDDFATLDVHHISNPGKLSWKTTMEVTAPSVLEVDKTHSLGMNANPSSVTNGQANVGVTWRYDGGPTTPYALIGASVGATTVFLTTDPAWPEGTWEIEVTVTGPTTCTIDFTIGSFTGTHSGTLIPGGGWCDIYAAPQVGPLDTNAAEFTNWTTEVL